MNISFVSQYKYLGIVVDYTMGFKTTLMNVTKNVRGMLQYKVFGNIGMSLTQRLTIWRTYFYSKILYPLVVLILLNKTAVNNIMYCNGVQGLLRIE